MRTEEKNKNKSQQDTANSHTEHPFHISAHLIIVHLKAVMIYNHAPEEDAIHFESARFFLTSSQEAFPRRFYRTLRPDLCKSALGQCSLLKTIYKYV